MSAPIKILILEDNPADAELLERILKKKMTCECYQSKDKPTFLHALDQFAPDIILSDHALPKFNSTDALVLSRLRFPGVPFIMVTGSVSEEFAANIMKLGADDYILKDRLARLPAAMEAALKRYNAERENREAQQKIIDSENNLRAIFENASEGFLLLDRNAVIKAFNSRVGDYTFISRNKEIQTGESIFDFIEESRKDFFKELISKALNGGKTQYERSYQRKNGDSAWIDFSITPVIETGEITGICITGRDITEKKTAEQQREFDNNNLKALINNTEDLMWSVDKDLKLITCNEAFSKVIDFTSGKRIEKGGYILSDQFTDGQKKRYKAFYERALSGEVFTVIDHFTHPFEFWTEVSFYPIRKGNEVIGTACFSRDITKRKKTEDKIRFDAALLDKVGQAIIATDNDGIIIYWNKAAEQIYGWLATEAMGKNIIDLTPTQQNRESAVEIMKALSKGNSWSGEFLVKRKDGSIFPSFTTDSPILNEEGKVIGIIGVSMDITERKKAEKEIADYKNALDQSAIVSITDQKGIINYVNDNFCMISGYPPEELIGLDHRILNSGFHPKTYIKDLWVTIAKGKIWRGEFRNKAKNGDFYWVDATIVPFLNAKGKPIQYLAIRNDITEKKLLEKEMLAQKIQEQKKIARAIITGQEKERNHIGQELHDNINQILAGTKMHLSIAGRRNEELKELIKYPMELIDTSIEEIRLLCHKLVTPIKNINLEEMVGNILTSLVNDTTLKTFFIYRVPKKLLSDDIKLNIYRIIQEQVNNIIKHAEAKTVTVIIETRVNTVNIIVEDDGKGFNLKAKRKGIGISNMENRVGSFNGQVKIKSGPGKGCQVKVTIPC